MSAAARHKIENLLHTYVEIADRKDVDAAVALLGRTRVRFPSGGFERPEDAAAFYTALWSASAAHRHDVTNLIVLPAPEPGRWLARAHYTRWVLDPDPVLHTLGEYSLVVDERDWSAVELVVTRTWTRP